MGWRRVDGRNALTGLSSSICSERVTAKSTATELPHVFAALFFWIRTVLLIFLVYIIVYTIVYTGGSMKKPVSVNEGKSKSVNFRVSAEMASDIAEMKRVCRQNGIKWNMSQALVEALEKELKSIQKYVQQETKSDWELGQQSMDF
jgi:hypothetical protein